MVQLLLELLLTGNGQLDATHVPMGPATKGPGPLALLQSHLSHAENAHLAGPLLCWARSHSPAAVLLLRLTCRCVNLWSICCILLACDHVMLENVRWMHVWLMSLLMYLSSQTLGHQNLQL